MEIDTYLDFAWINACAGRVADDENVARSEGFVAFSPSILTFSSAHIPSTMAA